MPARARKAQPKFEASKLSKGLSWTIFGLSIVNYVVKFEERRRFENR